MLLAMHLETSPHTRGKLPLVLKMLAGLGNIPAYAGKAGFFCSPLNFCQETSPHTRGKRLGKKGSVKKPGNIPAYAGKALSFDQLNDKQ